MFDDKVYVSKANEAEKRSAFNPCALTSLGVKIREDSISKEGTVPRSAEKRTVHEKKAPTDRDNRTRGFEELFGNDRTVKKENITVNEEINRGDSSLAALESLKPVQRKVFDEMPLDRAVTVDHLMSVGFSYSEVIGSLTTLEIKGLIAALPGGLYVRK